MFQLKESASNLWSSLGKCECGFWIIGELMLTIDEIRSRAEAILANTPERKQQVLHAHLS